MGKYTPSEDHPWRRYAEMGGRKKNASNKELTKEVKILICQRANEGEDPKALALEYGISGSYVSKLKHDWVGRVD